MAKSLAQAYFEKDLLSASSATVQKTAMQKTGSNFASPKKGPSIEVSSKQNLVTWEGSSTQRGLYNDDKLVKGSLDFTQGKKGAGFANYYTTKASSSVERVTGRNEKSPYKNGILPTLKLSISNKKLS